jgi:hypothetical protein
MRPRSSRDRTQSRVLPTSSRNSQRNPSQHLVERDAVTRDRNQTTFRLNRRRTFGNRQRRQPDQILTMPTRHQQPIHTRQIHTGTINQMHPDTLLPLPRHECHPSNRPTRQPSSKAATCRYHFANHFTTTTPKPQHAPTQPNAPSPPPPTRRSPARPGCRRYASPTHARTSHPHREAAA